MILNHHWKWIRKVDWCAAHQQTRERIFLLFLTRIDILFLNQHKNSNFNYALPFSHDLAFKETDFFIWVEKEIHFCKNEKNTEECSVPRDEGNKNGRRVWFIVRQSVTTDNSGAKTFQHRYILFEPVWQPIPLLIVVPILYSQFKPDIGCHYILEIRGILSHEMHNSVDLKMKFKWKKCLYSTKTGESKRRWTEGWHYYTYIKIVRFENKAEISAERM